MPGVLFAGHMLQAPWILLECVTQAGAHPYVQAVLADFAKDCGFTVSQVDLELSKVWVACRSRWWCLLVSDQLGRCQLQPWKSHGPWHHVGDVFRKPHAKPHASEEEIRQLTLTPYELREFESRRPLPSFLLQGNRPLPTALHAWGCQVYPCPCECRKFAFRPERLDERICAVLVQLESGAYRHMSGPEVAYLNGLRPDVDFGPDARLALCLVGQLASPVQSAWVTAQLRKHLSLVYAEGEAPPEPVQVQKRELLAAARTVGFLAEGDPHKVASAPVEGSCTGQATGARLTSPSCNDHRSVGPHPPGQATGSCASEAAVGFVRPIFDACQDSAAACLPAVVKSPPLVQTGTLDAASQWLLFSGDLKQSLRDKAFFLAAKDPAPSGRSGWFEGAAGLREEVPPLGMVWPFVVPSPCSVLQLAEAFAETTRCEAWRIRSGEHVLAWHCVLGAGQAVSIEVAGPGCAPAGVKVRDCWPEWIYPSMPAVLRARIQLRQFPCVADDEVLHGLLDLAGGSDGVVVMDPLEAQWFLQQGLRTSEGRLHALQSAKWILTAAAVGGHWISFAWSLHVGCIVAWNSTASDAHQLVVAEMHWLIPKATRRPLSQFRFRNCPDRHAGMGYCGHQALMDLRAFLTGAPWPDRSEFKVLRTGPINSNQAVTLLRTCVRAPFVIGAGVDALLEQGLSGLLREKGVPVDQVKQRAADLLRRVGASKVQGAMTATNQWRQLKGRMQPGRPALSDHPAN